MERNGFSHVLFDLFARPASRNTSGKIGGVGGKTSLRWLNDYQVFFHDFKPACFRMLFNVPGARSSHIEQHPETGRFEVMKKYLIVIEPTQTGFSAYSPDLPGCVSTGRTREEVEQNMREAIAFHLDGLREEGQKVPEPQTYSAYVELPA